MSDHPLLSMCYSPPRKTEWLPALPRTKFAQFAENKIITFGQSVHCVACAKH